MGSGASTETQKRPNLPPPPAEILSLFPSEDLNSPLLSYFSDGLGYEYSLHRSQELLNGMVQSSWRRKLSSFGKETPVDGAPSSEDGRRPTIVFDRGSFSKGEGYLRQSTNKINPLLTHAAAAKKILDPLLIKHCKVDNMLTITPNPLPLKERLTRKGRKLKGAFSKIVDVVSYDVQADSVKAARSFLQSIEKEKEFSINAVENYFADFGCTEKNQQESLASLSSGDAYGYKYVRIFVEVSIEDDEGEQCAHVCQISVHLSPLFPLRAKLILLHDKILFAHTDMNKRLSSTNPFVSHKEKRSAIRVLFEAVSSFSLIIDEDYGDEAVRMALASLVAMKVENEEDTKILHALELLLKPFGISDLSEYLRKKIVE